MSRDGKKFCCLKLFLEQQAPLGNEWNFTYLLLLLFVDLLWRAETSRSNFEWRYPSSFSPILTMSVIKMQFSSLTSLNVYLVTQDEHTKKRKRNFR